MPKICKFDVQIETDKTRAFFNAELYYSNEEGFYTKIPEPLHEAFDRMTPELTYTRGAFVKERAGKKIRGVWGKTDEEARKNARTLFGLLLHDAITERNVIVLFFSDRTVNFNHHIYDKQYPAIGLQMGLTYCTEITLSGDTPKYFRYREYNGLRGIVTEKSQIHITTHGTTIIPDTEENRAFVESIYSALAGLSAKLKEYTGTTEALLGFIASKQNLLTN